MFGTGFDADETRLYEEHRAALELAGLPPKDARKAAKARVRDAIAESKAQGYYKKGPLGTFMLQQCKTAPDLKDPWEAMKNDGVTEEDVIEWWNLPDLERRLMRSDDDAWRVGAFVNLLEQGLTSEEASRSLWKTYPTWGDCRLPPTYADDDTSVPLPEELKLRVIRWQERMQQSGGLEKLKPEVQGFSTMNGLIRDRIRAGEI